MVDFIGLVYGVDDLGMYNMMGRLCFIQSFVITAAGVGEHNIWEIVNIMI